MNLLDENNQQMAVAQIIATQETSQYLERIYHNERTRPFMLLKPAMFIDGNQWCALYGEDLQNGVAGFGDTPALASVDFDKEWLTRTIEPAK